MATIVKSRPFLDRLKTSLFNKKRYSVTVKTQVAESIVHTEVSVVAYTKAEAHAQAKKMVVGLTSWSIDKAHFVGKIKHL
jgi:hypothetical protein